MKVLLLSPYDAPSHAYWRRGLCDYLSDWQWTCLTLPPRFFSWRIRGNSLTWGLAQRPLLEEPYDLVLATSMTDLATLRGLVPRLGRVPSGLYFHENQFAYPASAQQRFAVEPQMVSLYSALAADRLLFNSHYNMTTFLSGVGDLLKKLPDAVPEGVVETLQGKAEVLPVPLFRPETPVIPPETPLFRHETPMASRPDGPLQVVWNHRWEYDKGPERLLAAVQSLPAHLPLQFHVLGQRFRKYPPEFDTLERLLQSRGWLGCWGYLDDVARYNRLLGQAHLVISTAHHDFQGLAVLEAVARGCIPLVPDRLAYPEWFAPCWRYPNGEGETAAMCERIETLVRVRPAAGTVDVSSLYWDNLGPCYRSVLTQIARTQGAA